MTSAASNWGAAGAPEARLGPAEYAKAVLNILEDYAFEKVRLEATQRAALNILEDFSLEKMRLEETQKAVLNILEDLAVEKARLQDTQQEVVRSEQAIRASLREKEVLLKEIHHRVKNNLQVISSLLSLQSHHLVDPVAQEMFAESQGRVRSIALVHEKLYESKDLSHIDFHEYARTLVESLLHAQDAAQRGISALIDITGIRLSVDAAIPCGLIINELVTNALKHAFPIGRPGSVHIRVQRVDLETVELTVRDDGIGFPPHFDPRNTTSLGLDLVFTLAEQLEAKVEITKAPETGFSFCFAAA